MKLGGIAHTSYEKHQNKLVSFSCILFTFFVTIDSITFDRKHTTHL